MALRFVLDPNYTQRRRHMFVRVMEPLIVIGFINRSYYEYITRTARSYCDGRRITIYSLNIYWIIFSVVLWTTAANE